MKEGYKYINSYDREIKGKIFVKGENQDNAGNFNQQKIDD